MIHFRVKDLMVPLSEYATVQEGATLLQAVLALEKAQQEFDHTKYRHRAVLILNREQRVIGKLSHSDVLRALEPQDDEMTELEELENFGFSPKFIGDLRKRRRLEVAKPLTDINQRAVQLKVEDFMQTPGEGEYIPEEASLDLAIHQLVLGPYLSLLVTRGEKITGILRSSDVFAAVFHTVKEHDTAK